jgi:hypothetical protein
MAARAHLVVDGRGEGLPSAPGYYRVFPKEPSPLGDLSFAPATTVSFLEGDPDQPLRGVLLRQSPIDGHCYGVGGSIWSIARKQWSSQNFAGKSEDFTDLAGRINLVGNRTGDPD